MLRIFGTRCKVQTALCVNKKIKRAPKAGAFSFAQGKSERRDENFKNRRNIAKNAENERKHLVLEKLAAAVVKKG